MIIPWTKYRCSRCRHVKAVKPKAESLDGGPYLKLINPKNVCCPKCGTMMWSKPRAFA